ncbi:MAG: hypothetical protein ACE37J_11800 [Pikeienuella sp.]|uniref:hypothetical protein n=1 Tax=Pikeienuella sp. TaxID=2831957 RepID=UPI00391DEA67
MTTRHRKPKPFIADRVAPFDISLLLCGKHERIARTIRFEDEAWPFFVMRLREGALLMMERLGEKETTRWRTPGRRFSVRELLIGVAAWIAAHGPADRSVDRFRPQVALVGRFMDGALKFEVGDPDEPKTITCD